MSNSNSPNLPVHTQSIEDLKEKFTTDLQRGLTSEDVAKRIEKYGYNELIAAETISPLKIFLLQFKDFMVYLLMGAAILSIIFSEWIEAGIIIIIVILNAVLGFVQEYRAEAALEKLKELTGDDTVVVRDGIETRIDVREIVPGDILLCYEGETIAADGRIFQASRLRVEEGLLTGESVPVDKTTSRFTDERMPIADRTNLIYMGTTTVKGRGRAIVTGTGMNTEMGHIAKSTVETEEQETPLQIQLSQLGKVLGIIVLLVVFLVLIAQIMQAETAFFEMVDQAFQHGEGELIEVIETALALAVSAVPEGLAAAITLTFAIGVQRMARKNAVIRKLPAVETLGSVEVICSDKTGTLTQNKMTVQKLWAPQMGFIDITGTGYLPKGNFIQLNSNQKINIKDHRDSYQLLKAGTLCNTAAVNYSSEKSQWVVEGDPTEGALIVAGMKAALLTSWEEGYVLKENGEIFFDSDRKRMTMVFDRKRPGIEQTWAFMKGSPGIVLDLCTHVLLDGKRVPLTEDVRQDISKNNSELASQAFRVLGVAQKELSNDETDFTEESVENEMTFLGLIAMIDPPRTEVEDAIRKCKNAGIRIIMITGDQLDTALAIAKSLDLKPYEDTFYLAHTSTELEAMNDDEFKEVLKDLDVCARASPSIKRRIVQTLQDEFGLVVAMTGDGVNDAPALKKADIGIAMGITGTDVAREASDMVLMDDNFSTIVSAIEEGRIIYANMKKFIRYLLSSNFDEILVVFTATVLLNLPSPYLALGILWINLLTDGLPALALSIDPGDPNIMKAKPRGRQSNMLNEILIFSLVAGIISFVATMIFFLASGKGFTGEDLKLARTLALTVSVVFELFQVFVSRAPDDQSVWVTNPLNNIYLIGAVGLAFVLHLCIVYIEPLANIFELTPLTFFQWVLIFGVVIFATALLDVIKLVLTKFVTRSSK
ncbi:MAG: cation-translocating P-type ATPase [Candidatus Hodarchaeales archaeon]|jgi:Ca2+-transporting ATPase